MATVKLWDGIHRTSRRWDSLRKDDHLWDPDGDCFVHLYSPGQSKRGPSFCVPLKKLVACHLEEFIKSSRDGVASRPVKTKRVRFSSQAVPGEPYLDLFVPAPTELTKDDVLDFHVTTRNLIAWVLGKPLVGHRLGKSLMDLVERLGSYRIDLQRNRVQVTRYAISQGYSDSRGYVEHGLGMLNFAEYVEDEQLWKEAFIHCVGMSAHLSKSLEYQSASYKTTVMLNQCRRRMDIQIKNANRALSHFFHPELAGVHFGLAGQHRTHYDAFRSYLHNFYKDRFHGHWPPANLETEFQTARSIVLSMYAEFRNLYNYLVDSSSSCAESELESTIDDLGILQRIVSFDQKHRFETLKNPKPLLPRLDLPSCSTSKRESLQLRRRRESLLNRKMELVSLLRATNRDDLKACACPLTLHYASFEKSSCLEAEAKTGLSLTEGRQIRWLLIYAIVQTLVSVLRAPAEVKDSITGAYPLCCKVPRRLPWQGTTAARQITRRSDSASSRHKSYHGRSASGTGSMETDLTCAIRKLALRRSVSVRLPQDEPPMTIPSTFTQMPATISTVPAFSNTPFVNKRTALNSHTPSVFTSDRSSYMPLVDSHGNGLDDSASAGVSANRSTYREHARTPSVSSATTAATMTDASTRTDVSPISEAVGAEVGDLTEMDHLSITDEGDGEVDGDEDMVERELPPEERAQIVRFLRTSKSIQTITESISVNSPPSSRDFSAPRPHFDLVEGDQ